MSRGPSYHGRRTPLPGTEKRSHLRVVPRRYKLEDERAGVTTVTVKPALHAGCRLKLTEGADACPRCKWLVGIEDPDTAYFDFWMVEGGY